MSHRLIQVFSPAGIEPLVLNAIADRKVLQSWSRPLGEDQAMVLVLVRSRHAEEVLDDLQSRFSATDGFRVVVLPVEAVLPPPPAKEDSGDRAGPDRISRAELYEDVTRGSRVSGVFVAMVSLSTVVAAIGLLRDDLAVIIGAMVIAPLLGPNVSLALATTLADLRLAVRSLRANAIGLAVALLLSLAIGALLEVDVDVDSIQRRTQVSMGDSVLALAAGAAGVLAFTSGAAASLIGVMVAVALLPPFVVFGLLLASGHWTGALGALLLTGTNVICVNLAGVVTFLAHGIRPRTWWQSERAKKTTRIAVAAWGLLLLALLLLVAYSAGR